MPKIDELNAAYTVALGIHANAIKARSLCVNFPSNPVTKNATNHLTVTPTIKVRKPSAMRDGYNKAI